MSDNREKFLLTASVLMEKQGYCGTGLNEILEKSGAPKGSLYYYFPDGKEQIASEVALRAGKIISGRIQERTRDQPEAGKAIHEFLYTVALRMEETQFHTGSTITMVAMESVTQSERINLACREAYGMIIGAFKDVLIQGGWEEAEAESIAEMIVAAVEGGIMLSRTYQSADYLRRVADHIQKMLASTKT